MKDGNDGESEGCLQETAGTQRRERRKSELKKETLARIYTKHCGCL